MKHSTGTPTKAEQSRMDAMKELGCIACRLRKTPYKVEAEIHHYLSGNKRRGHAYTVPLCPWHHKGEPWWGMTSEECLAEYGPSFHRHTRKFRQVFGRDDELIETTNAHLAGGFWRE